MAKKAMQKDISFFYFFYIRKGLQKNTLFTPHSHDATFFQPFPDYKRYEGYKNL